MNILNEIRTAFGFPQLVAMAPQEEQEPKLNATPRNYTINNNGDDAEDYFDQLGAAV